MDFVQEWYLSATIHIQFISVVGHDCVQSYFDEPTKVHLLYKELVSLNLIYIYEKVCFFSK